MIKEYRLVILFFTMVFGSMLCGIECASGEITFMDFLKKYIHPSIYKRIVKIIDYNQEKLIKYINTKHMHLGGEF